MSAKSLPNSMRYAYDTLMNKAFFAVAMLSSIQEDIDLSKEAGTIDTPTMVTVTLKLKDLRDELSSALFAAHDAITTEQQTSGKTSGNTTKKDTRVPTRASAKKKQKTLASQVSQTIRDHQTG